MNLYELFDLKNQLYQYCYVHCKVLLYNPPEEKTFYISRINPDNSITGFTPNLNQEWEIHTVFPKKVTKYKPVYLENLPGSLSTYQTQFIKIGFDHSLKYGDGGYADLHYPIYFCESLPLPTNVNELLIKKLEAIGAANQDWHTESPVLDIIDPDLAPNYYFAKNTQGLSERSKYTWFPVDVTVTPNRVVNVSGPIHNLEMRGNKALYQCIFRVFKEMIPGFDKLGIVNRNAETRLQVIVKAQKYVIQPGTTYSGKWHVEGKTENIIAAGVYYCKIDEGFEQDSVVFKPKVGPDDGYSSMYHVNTQQEIHVKETSSIVFSNTLPHKFLNLANTTSVPLSRLFINFFIVDPQHPLESTTLRYLSFKGLSKMKKLPKIMIDEILSYIFYKPTIFEAKSLREKTRESMKTEKSGWGYIHYGNCGDVEFIDEKTSKKKIDRFDTVVDSSFDFHH